MLRDFYYLMTHFPQNPNPFSTVVGVIFLNFSGFILG